MNKRIQRIFYYWMPYITYTLLLLSSVLVQHVDSGFFSKRILLLSGILGLSGFLFGQHIFLCFRASSKQERHEARFSLFITTLGFFLLLTIIELFLPTPHSEYSATQKALQLQFERRNQVVEYLFRDIQMKLSYNNLGWADDSKEYVPKPQYRIIFIGDSFLEVHSSKNLSRRIEDLLKNNGTEIEVINFSKDDTGPEQYRHKFYEFALELQPEQIIFFLYEANDLSIGYRYTPYMHPPFRITDNALKHLDTIEIPEYAQKYLQNVNQEKIIFHNKMELFRTLQNMGLTVEQKNLIYLAAYGYFHNEHHKKRLFQKTLIALNKLSGKLIDYVRTEWYHKLPDQRRHDEELYRRYREIFKLPQSERLEAIAKFMAQEYLLIQDYRLCLQLLQQQDERFISLLIAQQDMLYYLFPAIEHALQGNVLTQKKPVNHEVIERATDEYMKLFDEMGAIAEDNDITLIFVLIPEASYADEDFHQFWLPMIDFQQYFSEQHALYLSLKNKLIKKFFVIDLAESSSQLRNNYWKFDGHWNETGHQHISNILATEILSHKSPKELSTKW
ncbi:hypothetical protein U27_02129 [Candidatus Vecturithrix granuli]|uniref:AlgX/AlgJ SGNH hydrolase-like domain-containing protein n=1 Tax=Vecturithrix granuli TaxID=1499967 RepID=A0A0S6WAG5_VECG1|nr:hypothetical protein U27_02129 [Candidatus Vecturithrix granuli]